MQKKNTKKTAVRGSSGNTLKASIRHWGLLFLGPVVAAFAIGFVWPFLQGIYLSLCKFRLISDAEFIGFGNYVKAFQDASFTHSFWYTALFALTSLVIINVLAFAVAYALTQEIKGSNLFRTVFFMPNLIGGIVLGYIWQLILNGALYPFGVTLTSNARYGFWGLVVLMNWQLTGYMMIIYIAGLQNIPDELSEAANIDGATGLQRLWHITLPMVMPSITICTFLTLTNSFKLFDQNLALTSGAPSKQTAMLALDIYNTFYGKPGFEGVGQAKAVLFFLMVGLIAFLQLLLTRRKEVEG